MAKITWKDINSGGSEVALGIVEDKPKYVIGVQNMKDSRFHDKNVYYGFNQETQAVVGGFQNTIQEAKNMVEIEENPENIAP